MNLEGKPLLFGSKDTMTMCQGRESLSMARFTGFTLMPGEYGLEMSPGGSGLLTMYIDSREPSPIEHQYFHLLEMVNAGTFTADSYQEEAMSWSFGVNCLPARIKPWLQCRAELSCLCPPLPLVKVMCPCSTSRMI